MAQTGRSLCVSETVFPQASRHGVRLVCGNAEDGAGRERLRLDRLLGGEFVDMRRPGGLAPGYTPTAERG